jgi:hypothetical protein
MITETDKQVDPILAGLSWMTVMNLKWYEPDAAHVTASGPDSNGKFTGWILTLEGRPVVNTPPFDSAELAINHIHAVIKACKAYEHTKISTSATKHETQSWFPFAQAHTASWPH